MKILLACRHTLPIEGYGGRPRIVWWLGKELAKLGHEVTLLAGEGSVCPFGSVKTYDSQRPLDEQIPRDIDVVHAHFPLRSPLSKPYLCSIAGNSAPGTKHDINAVFVSREHAQRHGAMAYVHNGIDPRDYGAPQLDNQRAYVHFLGKAAWKVKNLRGAMSIARRSHVPLEVIGGTRLSFHMGFRLTLDPRIRFCGVIGGNRKNRVLQGSKALLFPVRWPEPFGIALVESLYFGCPVIGTPYGSLPELIPEKVGFLSDKSDELVEALKNVDKFDKRACHQHVLDHFTSARMARVFVTLYQRVIDGETLNESQPVSTFGNDKVLLPFE